jgi:hypothetical protein
MQQRSDEKMHLDDILSLAPNQSDREELLNLSKQYYDLGRSGTAPDSMTRQDEVLDLIMAKFERYIRAARFPIPSRHEVGQMIMEHFE